MFPDSEAVLSQVLREETRILSRGPKQTERDPRLLSQPCRLGPRRFRGIEVCRHEFVSAGRFGDRLGTRMGQA